MIRISWLLSPGKTLYFVSRVLQKCFQLYNLASTFSKLNIFEENKKLVCSNLLSKKAKVYWPANFYSKPMEHQGSLGFDLRKKDFRVQSDQKSAEGNEKIAFSIFCSFLTVYINESIMQISWNYRCNNSYFFYIKVANVRYEDSPNPTKSL